jgi:hypothetical protein
VAIDTEAKRNSALLDICGILIPDGSIGASDRQTLLGCYSPTGSEAFVYPGGSSFSASGPGNATFTRIGVGNADFSRTGPGNIAIVPKTQRN